MREASCLKTDPEGWSRRWGEEREPKGKLVVERGN